MRKHNRLFNLFSITLSILLVINNVAWAAPGTMQIQSASSLRELSTGIRASGAGEDSPAADDLKNALTGEGGFAADEEPAGDVDPETVHFGASTKIRPAAAREPGVEGFQKRVARLTDAFLGARGSSMNGSGFLRSVFDPNLIKSPSEIDPESNALIPAVAVRSSAADSNIRRLSLGEFWLPKQFQQNGGLARKLLVDVAGWEEHIEKISGGDCKLEYLVYVVTGNSAKTKSFFESCGIYDVVNRSVNARVFVLDSSDP
ncbi:MAG: hypothetical protein HQ558_00525, partial [Candidatus Omnitrophica bacterium]|nr:hypothetical protein [Candidatus Omnitrophota bacterium]